MMKPLNNENPLGFTPELEEICAERCAGIAGEPACWRLPQLIQPCELITPCEECLADYRLGGAKND